jgi:hypothetical protein
VYVVSRLRESLSGSLSVSSIRHVLGIGLLGIFGGDLGEWGRCLCFLDGGGVDVLRCVGCVVGFVGCVCAVVGDDGSFVGTVWFGSGVCLVVVWLFKRVWAFVVCVLLRDVRGCVLCGGLRRLPALKVSFFVCGCFVVVVLLSGFGCLVRGASGKVVCVSCSMGRFLRLRGLVVVVVGFLFSFSGCLSFVVSLLCNGILCGGWFSFVGLAWKL